MGDNITPPQQAFNWVADVYGSTEEIKARGQVIVGLMHEDIGHLGIFVSGKVAKKEHAGIVSVLKSVESLPPGLYAMEVVSGKDAGGKPVIEVTFHERRLEEIARRLNRFERADEKAFEAVAAVSDFNQRAYELFAQPLVQSVSNELTAKIGRELHPLRAQRWMFSDLNPWLAWLGPAAQAVRANRKALEPQAPSRCTEAMLSEVLSASLDCYRALRDAASEARFFHVYGNLFALHGGGDSLRGTDAPAAAADPLSLPVVSEALAAIDQGGYAAALTRVAALLASDDAEIPLARIESKRDLVRDYADLLPRLSSDEWRRTRGRQDIIVRYARDRALETLPALLAEPRDRERFHTLLDRLAADPRLLGRVSSASDRAVIAAVRRLLGAPRLRLAAVGRRKGG